MAKIGALLDGFKGKLGGFTIYPLNGKPVIRRLPKKTDKTPSDKQLLQRAKFSAVKTIYKSVKESVLYQANKCAARELKIVSGYNYFIKNNMNVIGKDNSIDYRLLKLTGGVLQFPLDFELQSTGECKCSFTWVDNSFGNTSNPDDELFVAIIDEEEPYIVKVKKINSIQRVDGAGTVDFTDYTGKILHVYCFFGNKERDKFSQNLYYKLDL